VICEVGVGDGRRMAVMAMAPVNASVLQMNLATTGYYLATMAIWLYWLPWLSHLIMAIARLL
jgi:hypothetical protein